jgi:hypothetical protein
MASLANRGSGIVRRLTERVYMPVLPQICLDDVQEAEVTEKSKKELTS